MYEVIISGENTYTLCTTDTFPKARIIANSVKSHMYADEEVWVYENGHAYYRAV